MTTDTKVDTLTAVNRALALLGRGKTTAGPSGTVMPAARARNALEVFAKAGTIEELDAQMIDLKRLVRDLLDWGNQPGETTRANGNVVKTVVQVLQARDADGRSLYPQAVEMLGFASAVAPLLQGDRIGRLIAEAPKVPTAYAPDRYVGSFHGLAHRILKDYNEQRREQLLVSLWHAVHDGRFEVITSGVTWVPEVAARRMAAEDRQAEEQIVAELLEGAEVGTDEGNEAVFRSLMDGRMPFNDGTAALVAQLPPTMSYRDEIADFAARMRSGAPVHPDKAVLLSYLPWARPDERPESPIAWVMRQLTRALDPDPDTGEALIPELPKKPRHFRELFPNDVVVGFPHQPAVRALDGRNMPGHENIRIEVVKNSAELEQNAEYMRNCTRIYKSEMEKGTYILFRLWLAGECYNAATVHNQHGWRLREVNSRRNAGHVPEVVRTAFDQLMARLPEPLETGARKEPNKGKFSMI